MTTFRIIFLSTLLFSLSANADYTDEGKTAYFNCPKVNFKLFMESPTDWVGLGYPQVSAEIQSMPTKIEAETFQCMATYKDQKRLLTKKIPKPKAVVRTDDLTSLSGKVIGKAKMSIATSFVNCKIAGSGFNCDIREVGKRLKDDDASPAKSSSEGQKATSTR